MHLKVGIIAAAGNALTALGQRELEKREKHEEIHAYMQVCAEMCTDLCTNKCVNLSTDMCIEEDHWGICSCSLV